MEFLNVTAGLKTKKYPVVRNSTFISSNCFTQVRVTVDLKPILGAPDATQGYSTDTMHIFTGVGSYLE